MHYSNSDQQSQQSLYSFESTQEDSLRGSVQQSRPKIRSSDGARRTARGLIRLMKVLDDRTVDVECAARALNTWADEVHGVLLIFVYSGIVEEISEGEFRLVHSAYEAKQNFQAIFASQKKFCSPDNKFITHAENMELFTQEILRGRQERDRFIEREQRLNEAGGPTKPVIENDTPDHKDPDPVDPSSEFAQLSGHDLKASKVGDSSQGTPNVGLIAANQVIAKHHAQLNSKESASVLMPKISDVKVSPVALPRIHGEGVRSDSEYPLQIVDENE